MMSYFKSGLCALYAVPVITVALLWNAGVAVSPAHAGGNGSIHIQSKRQILEPFEGRSHFEGSVKVSMPGTEISGGSADFAIDDHGKPQQITFNQNAKLVRKNSGMTQTIHADKLQMELDSEGLQANGGVTTKLTGDSKLGDVSIQSDGQVFDQSHHMMRASGNVVVKKEDMTATSPEAIIFMNAAGRAEKVVFLHGAHLVQGQQEMRGETITIMLNTGDIFAEKQTESLVLGKDSAGKPSKVRINAQLQQLDKATGKLIANGNAVIYYDDYVAKGPKAVFFRQQEQLDHIVLTGRAQIEDNDRKVVGDTVTITMNPKQFNAQGNVTTFIKAKKAPQTAAGGKSSAAPKAAPVSAESQAAKAVAEEQLINKATQEAGSAPR